MSVGRICIREVDLADANETAWQAAERMHDRAVGTLVIKDKTGRPVGIVTDRDLVQRVMAQGKDPHQTLVAEIMTTDPVRTYQDASIESAVALMRSGGFRRLPVVNHHDKLVGLLSLDDVLLLLCEEFTAIGELLKRQIPQQVVEHAV